eukprot:SAG31_NODE_44421_length_263_cov_0.567073_1_plen_50_part_10
MILKSRPYKQARNDLLSVRGRHACRQAAAAPDPATRQRTDAFGDDGLHCS